MEQSSEYREQLLESYKQAVRPLLPYLPWLEQTLAYGHIHALAGAERRQESQLYLQRTGYRSEFRVFFGI